MSPTEGWVQSQVEVQFCLEQAQFLGAGEGLGAAVRVEFGVEVIDVPLDRADGDDHLLCDFLIGQAIGDEAQDVALTIA